MASKEQIHDTGVLDAGEPLLLLDPVSYILQVHLNLRDVKREGMKTAVGNPLAAQAEEVIDPEFDDVGHQILRFEYQVFDYSVDIGVADFNSGNLDVR